MSLVDEVCQPVVRRFPRVSGDEPSKRIDASVCTSFSPRERG